jgi:hypothetical protein
MIFEREFDFETKCFKLDDIKKKTKQEAMFDVLLNSLLIMLIFLEKFDDHKIEFNQLLSRRRL